MYLTNNINNMLHGINIITIDQYILIKYIFNFIIFTFTYMCIHYLDHLNPIPCLWAESVSPSCSLILLKKKHIR
jgi:hypothetical protein